MGGLTRILFSLLARRQRGTERLVEAHLQLSAARRAALSDRFGRLLARRAPLIIITLAGHGVIVRRDRPSRRSGPAVK